MRCHRVACGLKEALKIKPGENSREGHEKMAKSTRWKTNRQRKLTLTSSEFEKATAPS